MLARAGSVSQASVYLLKWDYVAFVEEYWLLAQEKIIRDNGQC